MGIIKRLYPLLDGDADDPKRFFKKINLEIENIIKHMNKIPLEQGGQQQNFIYNIENLGSAGSVSMVEVPISFDKTSFTVIMKGKLLWIITSVKTVFTRGTKLKVMYGTTTVIHEEQAKNLNQWGNTAYAIPLDVNGTLSFSILGSPTAGSGKIILITS